jgi:hypothetical protein
MIQQQSHKLFSEPPAKTQKVRLGDVFLLGPAMIFMGLKKSPLSSGEKLFLITTGIGTVIYNLHNYVQEDRRQRYLMKK